MKNNKGITLTSLIIYIAVIFVVIAALMRVTTYFSSNMQDAADVSFETEFNKLNLYLLDETKTTGNGITNISEDGTQITFTNGNIYSYNEENKAVYLNGTKKICENIENCVFEELVADNGKNILELTIKINSIEKNVEYVLVSKDDNPYLLPNGYQEVEYIQSTGTQYIDTGIGPANVGQTVRIELDFQVTEYVNNTWICGTQELECGFSGGFYSHFTYSQTSDYLARTMATGSAKKTTTNKVMLFARDFNGTITEYRPAKVKIYSTSIYIDDELVRNFIPCYRKSDNVVGLYDLVNNVFYTNEGTGEFLKGENKDTIVGTSSDNQDFIDEEDYIFNIEGEIEDDTEEILLPSEYQQVEYIKSSGTQYINTEYLPDLNTNAKYKVAISSYATYGPHLLSSKNYYFPLLRGNKDILCKRGSGEFSSTSIVPEVDKIYEIEAFWDGKIIINGQEIGELTSTGTADTTPLYLGTYGGAPTTSTYILNGKIYYCKIYNGEELVRDMVPCYRISDSVVGMYDTVNDVFYTNAGTGTFEKGPNVN